MAVSHVYSNTNADATGTLTIWNGATTSSVAATNLVRPTDWNSAHNQYLTISGNTSGSSTMSGTNIVFGGTNGVTLSASSAANAATLWVEGMQQTIGFWPVSMEASLQTRSYNSGTTAATGGSSQTSGTIYMCPMVVDHYVTAHRISDAFSYATAAGTGSVTAGWQYGLYTQTGGSLSLLSSFVLNVRMSQSSVTAQSWYLYWGTNSTSNSSSWGGNSSASVTGQRFAPLFTNTGITITPGTYFWGICYTHRTSGASVGAFNTAMRKQVFPYEGFQSFGQSNTIGYGHMINWMGVVSTSSNGTTTGYTFLPNTIGTGAFTGQTATSALRWFVPLVCGSW